jgi:tripartite-type tricarboxylate transporter receptor subunit TctC
MTMKSAPSSFRCVSKAALAAAALMLAMYGRCWADYPEKPIRLLLPFPAGGAVDFVARLVSARMADELGRPFVIENKAGAGGIIATDATAKAAPDGYTVLLTTPNHTIKPRSIQSFLTIPTRISCRSRSGPKCRNCW